MVHQHTQAEDFALGSPACLWHVTHPDCVRTCNPVREKSLEPDYVDPKQETHLMTHGIKKNFRKFVLLNDQKWWDYECFGKRFVTFCYKNPPFSCVFPNPLMICCSHFPSENPNCSELILLITPLRGQEAFAHRCLPERDELLNSSPSSNTTELTQNTALNMLDKL